MASSIAVDALCMHFVAPGQDGPVLSEAPLPEGELRRELSDYLHRHMTRLLRPAESRRNRAARLHEDSPLPGWRERALSGPDECFSVSREMAQALHEAAPGNASPGLFAVTTFHREDDDNGYLALFKFRPSPSYKIQVLTTGDRFGLDIRDLENCLPEPREEPLYKSAIMPHPGRTDAPLKVHDDQSRGEPAQYFTKFLGCSLLETERAQVRGVFEAIGRYASDEPEEETDQAAAGQSFVFNQELLGRMPDLVDQLSAGEEPITYQGLIHTVEESGAFRDFSPSEFSAELQRTPAASLQTTPESFARAKMRYILPNGIVISGPAGTVMRHVLVDETGAGVEFRIASGRDFRTEYD